MRVRARTAAVHYSQMSFSAPNKTTGSVTRPLFHTLSQCARGGLALMAVLTLVPPIGGAAMGARAGPQTPGAQIQPDQANNASWSGAWTNLVNDARQTFRPSLHHLTAIEVELLVANPGLPGEVLSLAVFDGHGKLLTTVSQMVSPPACDHVLFVLPEGGLKVSTREVYAIRLSGGTTFGWKYVAGGYEKGAAWFNGRPLLPDARSTFLFRTFGWD